MDILPTNEVVILGAVNFELKNIEKQEEYEVTLDIYDEENENQINAVINTKILFIWSHFNLYNDMYMKTEALVNSYKQVLDKTNMFIDNLNGKY